MPANTPASARLDQRLHPGRPANQRRKPVAANTQTESPATTMTSCVTASSRLCSNTLPRAGSTNWGNSAELEHGHLRVQHRRQQPLPIHLHGCGKGRRSAGRGARHPRAASRSRATQDRSHPPSARLRRRAARRPRAPTVQGPPPARAGRSHWMCRRAKRSRRHAPVRSVRDTSYSMFGPGVAASATHARQNSSQVSSGIIAFPIRRARSPSPSLRRRRCTAPRRRASCRACAARRSA